jgi:hypothetical protein
MSSDRSLLLAAHPGHELLLYGWMLKAQPFVCVLTDGSGHSAPSRLHLTRELLAKAECPEGPIFGRFTDRAVYSAFLTSKTDAIAALVDELAGFLVRQRIDLVVTDAMEGFNPVHDLCRLIGGAACARAGSVARFEYPVYDMPQSYAGLPDATVFELDDDTHRRKLAAARTMAPAIADVADMLGRFGEEAFRWESLRRVDQWTGKPWPEGELPLYERIGEERVAAGRYDHVIRYGQHFSPLIQALQAESAPCAF